MEYASIFHLSLISPIDIDDMLHHIAILYCQQAKLATGKAYG